MLRQRFLEESDVSNTQGLHDVDELGKFILGQQVWRRELSTQNIDRNQMNKNKTLIFKRASKAAFEGLSQLFLGNVVL